MNLQQTETFLTCETIVRIPETSRVKTGSKQYSSQPLAPVSIFSWNTAPWGDTGNGASLRSGGCSIFSSRSYTVHKPFCCPHGSVLRRLLEVINEWMKLSAPSVGLWTERMVFSCDYTLSGCLVEQCESWRRCARLSAEGPPAAACFIFCHRASSAAPRLSSDLLSHRSLLARQRISVCVCVSLGVSQHQPQPEFIMRAMRKYDCFEAKVMSWEVKKICNYWLSRLQAEHSVLPLWQFDLMLSKYDIVQVSYCMKSSCWRTGRRTGPMMSSWHWQNPGAPSWTRNGASGRTVWQQP